MSIKNKILFHVSLLLLVLMVLMVPISFAYAAVKVSTSGNLITYSFNIEGVKTSSIELEGTEYLRARMVGVEDYTGILYEKGVPEIPTISFFVSAVRKEDIRVTFSKARPKSMGLGIRELMPNQESRPKIRGFKVPFSRNFHFYNTDQYWPQKTYEISSAGSIRGQKRFLVTVYPVKYNPVMSEFKIRENFSVEVVRSNEIDKKNALKGKKELFVFIVGDQFRNSPSLAIYKKFKEDLGYAVKTIVVGGNITSPDHIRAKLQEYYHSSLYDLKYAMIVGDSFDVPGENAHYCDGVTDHYYRAIDTSDYERDINGPDIGVGRITVSREDELEIVINKFVKYQKGRFNDESWLSSLAFIATDDRWQVAEGTHNHAIDNYTRRLGYLGDFPRENMPGGDQLYAITHSVSDSMVVDVMKRGRFIINYSGHGSTTSWAGPDVHQRDVRSFDHPDALPFVVSNACITGQFTVRESFGETWIKHPHGAIMFWGSMDSSYWDEDDYLEKFMYRKIFALGNLNFSQITQYSLAELWRQYNGKNRSKYYWETYVTFGDPSIRLRTERPRELIIQGPDALPMGVEEVDYAVKDIDGNPAENVRVALAPEEGGSPSVGYTNSVGVVTLKVPQVDPGVKINISISGDNIRQEAKELMLVSPEIPFYQVKNFSVNGRRDNLVSALEELSIKFDIRNISLVPSTGGKVIVEKVEGPVKIIHGEMDIPPLESDEIFTSNNCGACLRFEVLDAQSGDSIALRFKWSTDEGEERTFTRFLKVIRARLKISVIDFGNQDNPLEGSLGPSDGGDVYLTVSNTGTQVLKNARLEALSDNCVDSAHGLIEIENLAPGESLRVADPLDVEISGSCGVSDIAKVRILGTYDSLGAELSIEGVGSFEIGRYKLINKLEDSLDAPIPDLGSYKHEFSLGEIQKIKSIRIRVKVDHTYIGDISMTLVHPSGAKVKLRDRSGGSADDFDEVYTSATVSQLKTFYGLPADGKWVLEIRDGVKDDVGFLKYFEIQIKGLGT